MPMCIRLCMGTISYCMLLKAGEMHTRDIICYIRKLTVHDYGVLKACKYRLGIKYLLALP